MVLNVPFYKNDKEGLQCMQVAMQIVLKYYLNKEYSLEELDKLTGRKKGFWTYTPQMVTVLYDLGLDITYYSKSELEPYLQGEQYFRDFFGKDAAAILKHTDIPVVLNAIQKTLDYKLFKKGRLTIDDLEKYLDQNQLPILTIDHNRLIDREGDYLGHFIVLTGHDDEGIYYHESGTFDKSGPEDPTPNKKVSKEKIIEAWSATAADNDCIIVHGPR